MAESFKGFPKDFFLFFRELKAHNERPWFEANKERFRESVQAPMSAFIAQMAPRLAKIRNRLAGYRDSAAHFSETESQSRSGSRAPGSGGRGWCGSGRLGRDCSSENNS